jgi:transcriptional regulator with XRE-family HTH domain
VAGKRTELGKLLQERRDALGYSRTRTGEILGIPPGTIEGWELGRVAKPPIHDVLKLARFLGIATEEIEAAVLGEEAPEPSWDTPSPGAAAPLLEQAITLFGWTNAEAGAALRTTARQIDAWRTGTAAMTLPDVMAVAALIGLNAAAPVQPAISEGSSRSIAR